MDGWRDMDLCESVNDLFISDLPRCILCRLWPSFSLPISQPPREIKMESCVVFFFDSLILSLSLSRIESHEPASDGRS